VTGSDSCAGVHVSGGGSFTMTGGSIDYNDSGVYVSGGSTFTVSGSPVISRNPLSGTARNVYLESGAVIAVGGALTSTASVGVTLANDYSGAFTSGWSAGGLEDPASVFASDNSTSFLVELSGGEAAMTRLAGDWTGLKNALAAGGTVRLNADVSAVLYDDPTEAMMADKELTVPESVSATLDLCGHTVTGNGSGITQGRTVVFRVRGTLTLTDSGTTPRYGSWNEDWTAYTLSTAQPASGTYDTFATGGVITGGESSAGGGVQIENGGSFMMKGGAIAGNSAGDYSGGGGGVFVGVDSSFTLDGGMICGNYAPGEGGGVCVSAGGFELKSGTIVHNASAKYGGGVYVKGRTQGNGYE
jgi:hypothetical protein